MNSQESVLRPSMYEESKESEADRRRKRMMSSDGRAPILIDGTNVKKALNYMWSGISSNVGKFFNG